MAIYLHLVDRRGAPKMRKDSDAQLAGTAARLCPRQHDAS
jgi:hypothetical protein